MKTDALIGFSANPEVVGVFDSASDREKLPLLEFRVDLSGTAANVATALQKLGNISHLLGLTGSDGADEDILLQLALKKARFSFDAVRVLDQTSIALLPVDRASRARVVGRTGKVVAEKLDAAISLVTEFAVAAPEAWRVATGVRHSEAALVDALFTHSRPGMRVVGPHHTSCSEKPQGFFEQVLKNADLLILNEQEWEWLAGTAPLSGFHTLGPDLVIVTKAGRGGIFSLRGETGQFAAARCPDKAYSAVGAGDWFLGGLIHSFLQSGLNVKNLDVHALHACLSFAARVAAKKITMPGGGNGPMLAEL